MVNLFILRYLLVCLLLLFSVLPSCSKFGFLSARGNFRIWFCLLSSFLISSLLVLYFPAGVTYLTIYSCSWSSSYTLLFCVSKFGLLMSWLLDILVCLCYFYGCFTRYGTSTIQYEISLAVLYWCCVSFFLVDDIVLLSILYECQMVPLLWMLFSRYSIGSTIVNSGITIPLSSSKGLGQAMYLLVWYGLVSGVLLYVGFYNLYLSFGTTSLVEICSLLSLLSSFDLSGSLGCLFVFLSGAAKLSLCPFHVWLGKVHVEASTVGSVLLAGISLKTGFYLHVIIWHSLYSVLYSNYLLDIFCLFFLLGGLVSSFSLFYQVDIKRWVALYSVSHMNLFYLLLFGCIRSGVNSGSVLDLVMQYGMLGHSLVSGGLFFIVGGICDRAGTRMLIELSGLVSSWESVYLLTFLCANSGYPMLVLFIYEVLGYLCLADWDILLALLCGGLSSFCMLSSLLVYSRLCMVSCNVYSGILAGNNSLLLLISFPLSFISFLLGIQCLYPISFLS